MPHEIEEPAPRVRAEGGSAPLDEELVRRVVEATLRATQPSRADSPLSGRADVAEENSQAEGKRESAGRLNTGGTQQPLSRGDPAPT